MKSKNDIEFDIRKLSTGAGDDQNIGACEAFDVMTKCCSDTKETCDGCYSKFLEEMKEQRRILNMEENL